MKIAKRMKRIPSFRKTGVIKCNYFTWFGKSNDHLAENFKCWKTLENGRACVYAHPMTKTWLWVHWMDKSIAQMCIENKAWIFPLLLLFFCLCKRCTHINFCFYRNYSYAIVSLGHINWLCIFKTMYGLFGKVAFIFSTAGFFSNTINEQKNHTQTNANAICMQTRYPRDMNKWNPKSNRQK